MKDEDVYLWHFFLAVQNVGKFLRKARVCCDSSLKITNRQIMVSKYAGRCLSFLFFACYTCYDVCVCHSCNKRERSRWLAQIVTHWCEMCGKLILVICKWFSSHTNNPTSRAFTFWWSRDRKLHTLIAKMSDEPGQLDFLWLENTRDRELLLYLATFELFRSHFKPQKGQGSSPT